MTHKWLLICASLMALISVGTGAFGAHALKQRLTAEMLHVFEIGARYQMYHALAIFISVWLATVLPGILAPLAGWLFFAGILIFSGSLYALALTEMRLLGAITPIGGVLFLAGWLCLIVSLIKS